MSPEPLDTLGDPEDFASMPDEQLLAMLDSEPRAVIELVRRYPR